MCVCASIYTLADVRPELGRARCAAPGRAVWPLGSPGLTPQGGKLRRLS